MTEKRSSDDKAPAAAPEVEALSEDVRKAMNIYQKIAAIMGEIGAVEKGGENKEQHYAFIENAAVAGRLRALFDKYMLVIIPVMSKPEAHIRTDITTSGGKKGVNLQIPFVFKVINADNPEDNFEVDWVGEASDYGDKGINKAATSALKYYEMKQFHISEKGEADPDAETIDRGSSNQGYQQPRQQYSPPKKAQLPARPANALMDDIERAALFSAMLKVGIDEKEEQLELLRINGITDPKSMTSGMAKTMINKLQNKAFARPQKPETPPVAEDTVVDVDVDAPVNLDDIPVLNEPTTEITEEVIAEITEKLQSLGLSQWGIGHLLKETVGTPFLKNLKSDQWRKLERRVTAIYNSEETVPDRWVAGFVTEEDEEDQGGNADLFVEPTKPDDDGDAQAGTFDPPIAAPNHEGTEADPMEVEHETAPAEAAQEASPVDDAFKEKISEDMKAKGITGAERLRMLREAGAISFKQMKDDKQWLKLRHLIDIHEGVSDDAK